MRLMVLSLCLLTAAASCTAILGDDFEVVTGTGGGSQGGGDDGGSAGSGGEGECGNSVVESGEDCDDGNTDASDGCVSCETEWTCETPGQILLMQDGGVLRGSLDGSTLDGNNHVDEATCGAASAGGGTDRVLSFTLEKTLDVFVTLESSFDGLLRATKQPCDLGGGLGCANELSTEGEEHLHLPALEAGTYFLLVDGADDEEAGAFDVELMACAQDRSDVVLKELHIGQSDYVMIENTGGCPVQLQGMQILFDDRDDAQPPPLEDCTTELPAYLLAPGASVRVHEKPLAGDIAALPGIVGCGAGVPFNPGRGSTAYLCDGVCVEANVIDMVSFLGNISSSSLGNPPTPIGSLSFAKLLGYISSDDQDDRRWVRTGFTGKNPLFTGADWKLESRVMHEEFDTNLNGWETVPGQKATIEISAEKAVGAGSVSLEQTGSNGISEALQSSAKGSPRHISFYTRVSATDVSAGFMELRSGGFPTLLWSIQPSGMGLEGDSMMRSERPFEADIWYHVELRNIDWTARTADLYIDSKLVALDVKNLANFAGFDEILLYSASSGSKVWWDNIEMWD